MELANFRKAYLFSNNGKWKYDVWLDYTDVNYDTWDLWTEARKALKCSTENNTSGVTIAEIPDGWMLVVTDPISKFQHPIMVRGTSTRLEEDICSVEIVEKSANDILKEHECKSIKYHLSSVHTCECGHTWQDEDSWRDREMKKDMESK